MILSLKDNWQFLETFLAVTTRGLLLASGRVEARDAAQHPKMHRTGPTAKNYLAQHVNSGEVKKLWFKQTVKEIQVLPESDGI